MTKLDTWYIQSWARQGIDPPPILGDPTSPGSVACLQGAREHELPPIDLSLSDEASVALMEAHVLAVYERVLKHGISSPIVGAD